MRRVEPSQTAAGHAHRTGDALDRLHVVGVHDLQILDPRQRLLAQDRQCRRFHFRRIASMPRGDQLLGHQQRLEQDGRDLALLRD